MTDRRLKIAYLCESSPADTGSHSGGNTRIYNALQEYVGDVTVLDQSWGAVEFIRQVIHRLPEGIRIRLRFRVHLLLSRFISRKVSKLLKQDEYDVLFCSYSFFCLSNLKLPYSILTAFTSDATYSAYKNSEVGAQYGSYFSLSRLLDPLILKREKRVYRNTDLLLWPSHWIKNQAADLYGLNDQQSHMVHWGANICPPNRDDLRLDKSLHGKIQLLLVGRDWEPKGGPIVIEVLKALIAKGVDAHLTVVGCIPPKTNVYDHMTVFPRLDKNNPKEYETFLSLYKDSHFFVMPSYEAYGFAFCEAGAYGLPALCLRVGGVPIVDDVNGHALPLGANADDFAETICRYIKDNDRYKKLCQSTREYYEEHLHWQAWGEKTRTLIENKTI